MLWLLLLFKKELALALTLVKRFFLVMNSNPCDFGGMLAAIGIDGLFLVVFPELSSGVFSIKFECYLDLNGLWSGA